MLDGVDVGLVAGGPPCQPFSRAGRSKIRSLVDQGLRMEDDPRKDMWRAFLELVEAIRPRAVLLENVPDMALGDGFTVLRAMIERLDDAGYSTDARIVDAWRHGVPQHRQRLFVVALKDGTFGWPAESGRVTVRHAISDLPRLSVSPDIELGASTMSYTTILPSDVSGCEGSDDGTLNGFAVRARRGCVGENARVVHDHVTRPVRADDFEAFKLMDSNTLYSDLPERLRRYRSDTFNDKYNRLGWDDLSRTVTAHLAKDGYWYIHPEQHRSLTVREAARLQTFPDTFRFAGYRSHQFQQIGNAVPPRLAQQIGSAILNSVHPGRARLSFGPEHRSVERRRCAFSESLLHWVDTDDDARRVIDAVAQGGARNERWVGLLDGRDNALVPSTAALRVASRVSGSKTGQQTSAKIELAKLVGFGVRSADRNIAAHALGTVVCKPRYPLCCDCPVSAVCATYTSADQPTPPVAGGCP